MELWNGRRCWSKRVAMAAHGDGQRCPFLAGRFPNRKASGGLTRHRGDPAPQQHLAKSRRVAWVGVFAYPGHASDERFSGDEPLLPSSHR